MDNEPRMTWAEARGTFVTIVGYLMLALLLHWFWPFF